MASHTDPQWVALGRAIHALLKDSRLTGEDQLTALDFVRLLLYHPAAPVTPVTAAAPEASATSAPAPAP